MPSKKCDFHLSISKTKNVVGGDNVFNLIKVVHTKLPPKIWEEDVLSKNTQSWGDETLMINETPASYTTRFLGGGCPYVFVCELTNNGKFYIVRDPLSGIWWDLYIIHLLYMKNTANLHLESSTMHKNPRSNIWQANINPMNH